jgi:hypothetical protein
MHQVCRLDQQLKQPFFLVDEILHGRFANDPKTQRRQF